MLSIIPAWTSFIATFIAEAKLAASAPPSKERVCAPAAVRRISLIRVPRILNACERVTPKATVGPTTVAANLAAVRPADLVVLWADSLCSLPSLGVDVGVNKRPRTPPG